MNRKRSSKVQTGALGSSRDYAVPLGHTVRTKIERGDRYSAPEIYNLEITVLEVLREREALERLKKGDGGVSVPKAGFEYLLVCIQFGYFSKGRGFGHRKDPYEIGEGYFVAVSPDGRTEYAPPSSAIQPQPQLIHVPFFPGEVKKGWIALQVPHGEEGSFLIFKRDYRENAYGFWGPVWFQLQPSNGMKDTQNNAKA